MSWASFAVGGIPGHLLALQAEKLNIQIAQSEYKLALRHQPPCFQPCSYCQKAPDAQQKEARCTSCGAPLKEKQP